jgi:hypothetical protein
VLIVWMGRVWRVCGAVSRLHAIRSDGLAGAIGLVGLFVSLFAGFAAGLYWLMQPSIAHNAGLTAYNPPPGTGVGYALARPPSQAADPGVGAAGIARHELQKQPSDPEAKIEEPPKPAVAVMNAEPAAPIVRPNKKKRKVVKRPQPVRTVSPVRSPVQRNPTSAYAASREFSSRTSTWIDAVDRGFIRQF